MWDQALEAEPFPKLWIAGERVDAAFMAIAALTGLKSPWLREHSTGVAELAEAAAWRVGLAAGSVTLVRRAALAHDLGRVGVSNAIWEKPGPLGFGEWERVRLHPHYTERAFAQSCRSPRLVSSRGHTTNGSMARATTAARAGRSSICRLASSLPPTATRYARGAALPAGARAPRRRKQSSCGRPRRGTARS